jgi:hypothetical protein
MADVAVTPAQGDSALKSIHGFGDKSAEQIKTALRKKIPAYRSFLTHVIAGFDQSAWVFTRSVVDTSQAREALIVDAHGEPLARVEIPVGFNPLYADREHLWGIDKRKPGVVRFKVQAQPEKQIPRPRSE